LICSVSDKKSLSVTTDQILGLATQELEHSENNLISYTHFKYKLNLPSEQDLKSFIEKELKAEGIEA